MPRPGSFVRGPGLSCGGPRLVLSGRGLGPGAANTRRARLASHPRCLWRHEFASGPGPRRWRCLWRHEFGPGSGPRRWRCLWRHEFARPGSTALALPVAPRIRLRPGSTALALPVAPRIRLRPGSEALIRLRDGLFVDPHATTLRYASSLGRPPVTLGPRLVLGWTGAIVIGNGSASSGASSPAWFGAEGPSVQRSGGSGRGGPESSAAGIPGSVPPGPRNAPDTRARRGWGCPLTMRGRFMWSSSRLRALTSRAFWPGGRLGSSDHGTGLPREPTGFSRGTAGPGRSVARSRGAGG